MGRREEIDAEIAKLQAEREALDGVVVIPADEWKSICDRMDLVYTGSEYQDTEAELLAVLGDMQSYKPQPLQQGGLTQEQGEQVLRWLERALLESGDGVVDAAGARLADMLGHNWAYWDSSEDPRG